ncbi:MAG: carboxypeptidase [Phototrophicales bacterium]|nr:MAG: carboxypeptidase [Phototrophicales bacterium]
MQNAELLAHYEAQLGSIIWKLLGLIEMETPTSEKSRLDELGDWMATWADELEAKVNIHPLSEVGNVVECRWNDHYAAAPIIICCHMDTVHPLGSVDQYPTHATEEHLYGMGAYDMKGGIVLAQTVIEDLIKRDAMPKRPIVLLLNSDEETGSQHSRPIIENVAKDAALVLVMEPGPAEDTIVTARKGVGIFEMTAWGRSSHAGSNPEAGVNAIIEMAHQIAKITALNNVELGTSVHPTIIHGGTKHNVIPEECRVTINVRVRYQREAERVLEALSTISHNPFLPEALVYLTGGMMRPPMEHNALMIQTVETLAKISPFPIQEFSKGGGSDGNFTAAMGIPTLDGLGPTGGGAHSNDEHVYLPSLPRRAALLDAILTRWPLA